ncbi:prepilin-type N-terminal cleavage/methylation domain-containing protein [Francisella tularensis subsp. holarctica]|nr:prepilin-type N-terminal cleavage/methylation domain-containing protein [Francisella tularensis]MDE4963580.1 prepilin-type N-terminal cleavage/methylation domain-containing protein [Francisella tularensis subsp. holarctica]
MITVKSKKGFSLTELLVVIAIIFIYSILFITS